MHLVVIVSDKQDQDQLVPAEASHQPPVADILNQPVRDDGQHLISHGVAVMVVIGFEIIQVNHGHGKNGLLIDQRTQEIQDIFAGQNPCQRIQKGSNRPVLQDIPEKGINLQIFSLIHAG